MDRGGEAPDDRRGALPRMALVEIERRGPRLLGREGEGVCAALSHEPGTTAGDRVRRAGEPEDRLVELIDRPGVAGGRVLLQREEDRAAPVDGDGLAIVGLG